MDCNIYIVSTASELSIMPVMHVMPVIHGIAPAKGIAGTISKCQQKELPALSVNASKRHCRHLLYACNECILKAVSKNAGNTVNCRHF
jgi:hypothetical protein